MTIDDLCFLESDDEANDFFRVAVAVCLRSLNQPSALLIRETGEGGCQGFKEKWD